MSRLSSDCCHTTLEMSPGFGFMLPRIRGHEPWRKSLSPVFPPVFPPNVEKRDVRDRAPGNETYVEIRGVCAERRVLLLVLLMQRDDERRGACNFEPRGGNHWHIPFTAQAVLGKNGRGPVLAIGSRIPAVVFRQTRIAYVR